MAGQATPGACEAVPPEPAHSRASELRPSTVIRGSPDLQPAQQQQGLQDFADTAPRPLSSSLRASAAAFKPGVRVHVAAGPAITTATAIAATTATLATASAPRFDLTEHLAMTNDRVS